VDTGNRRLIRPILSPAKEPVGPRRNLKPKLSPPDQTNAESFYYVKQMATRTPMVIVLSDGETFQGVIEWYDKTCLKITREDGPNLLLYKPSIRYMYKANP
jgi:sRNA-binding regulator protein Hfq